MLTVFKTVLEMSLTASVVILAVLAARAILSKAPKKYSYLLWIVVAFRLCVPFSFESAISIFNTTSALPSFETEVGTEEQQTDISETVSVPADTAPEEGTAIIPDEAPGVTPPVVTTPGTTVIPDETPSGGLEPTTSVTTAEPKPEPAKANPQLILGTVLAAIWLAGIAAMLGYGIVSYVKLNRHLQTAVRLEGNVYGSDRISSPFALGFLKPRIFIPFGLNESASAYILAHERYHIKRLDHLVKPLSFLILSVHWFNPLCWLAFNRMSLDMEMSCDEKILKQYGDEAMKKQYTRTLLAFATDRRFPAPSPISFSEGAGAKSRIKHALYWKKPKFWVSAAALLLCAVVLVACAANALSNNESGKASPADRIIDFGETPYQLTFESNGDGTCKIVGIKTDFDRTEPFDLIIPETSPAGDRVSEVDMNVLKHYTLPNVPTYLTAKQYDALEEKITAHRDSERDLQTFQAYYESYEPSNEKNKYAFAYYKLEPQLYDTETARLSEILARCADYTAADCYQDASAFSDLLTSEEQAALREELFRHLYRDASRIAKVILPNADVKVHQGFLGLSYFTADGTEVELAFENPVRLDGAEDDAEVDLYDEDAIYEIVHATTLTFERPVQDFSFIILDESEVLTYVGPVDPNQSGLYFEAGDTYTVKTYFNDVTYNRGIAFRGEDNKMHYYGFAIDLADSKMGLTDITEWTRFPTELSIREATKEEQNNKSSFLLFENESVSDGKAFIIETNYPLFQVNVCKFEANDYSEEDGWLYTASPLEPSIGELTPEKPLCLSVLPESITSTYGISFSTPYFTRYFAIFESDEDGSLRITEVTDQVSH